MADDPAYHGFLRVAHKRHVKAYMTLGAMAVMEAGLVALWIPHALAGIAAAAGVVGQPEWGQREARSPHPDPLPRGERGRLAFG
jgi:hypothetical protein